MKTELVVDSERYFVKSTFQNYRLGIEAFAAEEYLTAAVWGSVFVEALLKDILQELGVEYEGADLNNLISKVKNIQKHSPAVCPEDRNLFRDVAGRCNEIRLKRNRIVHDMGVDRGSIRSDARDIYENNLEHIIRQYVKCGVAQEIARKNRQTDNGNPVPQPTFPIFVSTITTNTFEEKVFVDTFCKRLEEIGVIPVRCTREDFGTQNPIEVIRERVSKCHALVVIGLEKYHVYHYKEIKSPGQVEEKTNISFSSEWLQLESGIAYGMRKKIFAMHQKGLHNKGIFGRSVSSVELEAPLDARSRNVDSVIRDIRLFVEQFGK